MWPRFVALISILHGADYCLMNYVKMVLSDAECYKSQTDKCIDSIDARISSQIFENYYVITVIFIGSKTKM